MKKGQRTGGKHGYRKYVAGKCELPSVREHGANGRQGVNRDGSVCPVVTCDKEYSDDELEFLRAIDRWRSEHGRLLSLKGADLAEVLRIAKSLGWAKA